MTNLFIQEAQRSGYPLTYGGREIALAATRERTWCSTGFTAGLDVLEGDAVVGSITPYTDDEHGAVSKRRFGQGAPAVFRTLDGALREILS